MACKEKTSVSGRQFDDAERHSFLVPYLSNKIQQSIFHRLPVKTVAYLRFSTAQQDVRSQRLAILEYARIQGFPIDNFIEATASGQASEKRRRLDELMSVLQRGDRLVVRELSRLGRTLGQIVAILDALANPKAKAKGEGCDGRRGGCSGRDLPRAGARWGGSVAGCGKKGVGGADRARPRGRGWCQRRAVNCWTLSPAWRAMRRSMLGGVSLDPWTGTVTLRPSGWRKRLWEPRWRTSRKPSAVRIAMTSRGLRTGTDGTPVRRGRCGCRRTRSRAEGLRPRGRG